MRMRALVCACLALTAGIALRAPCQESASAASDEAASFLTDAGEEAARGSYIFYRQEYRDQRKERVSIHGSVYGVLRDVKLKGCEVEGTVQVFDLFSGFIKDRPTGEMQDLTEYSIRFRLSTEIVSGMSVVEARPSQLAHAMHTQCEGDGSCTFHWLRIRSAHGGMSERIVVNQSITYDGKVKEILAPVSSGAAGNQLIRDLRAIAESRCK